MRIMCELFQRCVKLVEISRHLFGSESIFSGSISCELKHHLEDFNDADTCHKQLLNVVNNCPQAMVLHLDHMTSNNESHNFIVRRFFIPFHESFVMLLEELISISVLLFKVVGLRCVAVSVVNNVQLCWCGGVHWA